MNTHTNPTRHRAAAAAPANGVLTDHEWAETLDCLRLALVALGDKPLDMDRSRFTTCLLHQRAALRITHRRLGRAKP